MKFFVFIIGLLFFIPGLISLGYSLNNGPIAWSTDINTFWGMPIVLFVFFIGLAHAGTLISAIFLSLGVKIDKRTLFYAELSTLCCLIIAGIFPLIHLGVVKNFYMIIPLLDARSNMANVMSPLVWDLCCIIVYSILSLLFFVSHLLSENKKYGYEFKGILKPFAWVLFPLVLWVHTIVSLDFAVTFVKEWSAAYFPLYFIVGAIFSGLSLINLIIAKENYRVILLEKLMIVGSWFIIVFWLWNLIYKDSFSFFAFLFAGLIPQLFFVKYFRESNFGKFLISFSILLGMLIERICIVMPNSLKLNLYEFTFVDYGMILFGIGLFLILFYGIEKILFKFFKYDFYELNDESNEKMDSNVSNQHIKYFEPFSTSEFLKLRIPLFFGCMVGLIYIIWIMLYKRLDNISVSFINVLPMLYPIIAFVTCILLSVRLLWKVFNFKIRLITVILLGIFSGLLGAFYAGVNSIPESSFQKKIYSKEILKNSDIDINSKFLWKSKCSVCHGIDGSLNKKFVLEYYPVPQTISINRIDSMGVDSMVKVIMNGRVNMNSYKDRLSENEARGLVLYMRSLAK